MLQIPQADPEVEPQTQGRFPNKLVLFMQYLLIGTNMNILYTLPYVYKDIPSYNIVAFFSLVCLIPSFRFLISPLIQNHTSLRYGKRKTWMIIATVSIAGTLFTSSHFTSDEKQIHIGFLFVVQNMFLGVNMTTIDALALKEYREKSKIGFLQSTVHKAGSLLGGLVFLKLISKTFCLHFGRTTPLLTVKQYFTILSVLYLGVALIAHFIYQEAELETEEIIMHKNSYELTKEYRIFFNLDNTYTRFLVFSFLVYMGFSCFSSGFRYNLIKEQGFNREDYVTITALMIFPVMPVSYLFSRHINKEQIASKYQIVLCCKCVADIMCFIIKPSTIPTFAFYYFVSDNLRSFESILVNTLMNSLSNVGLSGMFLSASSSLRKAIQNYAWSLKLIDIFGYQLTCIVGFIQAIAVVSCVPKLIDWVITGEGPPEVEQTPSEPSEKGMEKQKKMRNIET